MATDKLDDTWELHTWPGQFRPMLNKTDDSVVVEIDEDGDVVVENYKEGDHTTFVPIGHIQQLIAAYYAYREGVGCAKMNNWKLFSIWRSSLNAGYFQLVFDNNGDIIYAGLV